MGKHSANNVLIILESWLEEVIKLYEKENNMERLYCYKETLTLLKSLKNMYSKNN